MKYCPSCLRERYKAELAATSKGAEYPIGMQYCKGGYKVLSCEGDIKNSCERYGYYSCGNEERADCPCRGCCASLRKEYVKLNESHAKANRGKVFEMIKDDDI